MPFTRCKADSHSFKVKKHSYSNESLRQENGISEDLKEPTSKIIEGSWQLLGAKKGRSKAN